MLCSFCLTQDLRLQVYKLVYFALVGTLMAHMGRLMIQCVIHPAPPDPERVVGGSSTQSTAQNKTGLDRQHITYYE